MGFMWMSNSLKTQVNNASNIHNLIEEYWLILCMAACTFKAALNTAWALQRNRQLWKSKQVTNDKSKAS